VLKVSSDKKLYLSMEAVQKLSKIKNLSVEFN